MNTNKQGNIGEAVALKYFLENNYEVYLPFGTASKCDMIILKNSITQRVSVKTCRSKNKKGKYRVKIRQGKLNKEIPFDNESSDIVFIYLIELDKIHILESKDIKTKYEIIL